MRQSAILTSLIAAATVFLIGAGSQSPAPSGSIGATAVLTTKIVAIDQQNRILTLQDTKGNVQSIQVSPSVKRFSELKVGETVIFTYSESVATSIVKPGTMAPSPSPSAVITRFTGEKPGGEITQTTSTTVTIQSIDSTTPSVTVLTQDGRTVSMAVQDPKALAGFKVGDVVQVTYTQNLTITVK